MLKAFRKLLRALGMGGAENGGAEGNGVPGGRDPSAGDGEPVEMISCREALERLFEYLDGELDSSTDMKVAAHLEKCRRCYPRLEFEKAFMEALERARAGEEPPSGLRNRVVDVLCSEGFDPTGA